MKVAIVTPTIANKHLQTCIDSVQKQTYSNITHYVFVDGQQYYDSAYQSISAFPEGSLPIKTIVLEENVGKGWYGHRVYASCSFLVNADIIIYLDEDNWIEPNHVQSLVDVLKDDTVQWAYSLRNIHNKDGEFICQDNCESLGIWPVYFSKLNYHIDTSCFAIRRDVAVKIGHAWYGQWGADRQFFTALKYHFPKYACSKEYTLNYRLDGNEGSVKKEFFEEGNRVNSEVYCEKFPWQN